MIFGSIRARLLAWSAGLTLAALVVAWFVLSAVLSDFVTRRLQAELIAGARGVMAVARWDEAGAFTVIPPPSDARFDQPLSGWYWQVSDAAAVLARSPSLVTGDLGVDGRGRIGPDGRVLVTHVAAFTAPGEGRRLTVTVALPKDVADGELAAIRRPLAVALLLLGAALMGAQVLAVKAGLADLTRFARGVAALRAGQGAALPAAQAAELRPLADELDRLVAANAAQIARARAHAADLAHALKTPLAVLSNRAGAEDAALLQRMDHILRWHLRRARASALSDPLARAAIAPVLDDVALVLTPEARRRGVRLSHASDKAPDFRGDGEDLAEIIGALGENGVKWARSAVRIDARRCADGVEITVTDDGPGIPEAERDRLLGRGARLDETTPGHGLGLAIAADRIGAYGGRLDLLQAETGGLAVRVILPAWG